MDKSDIWATFVPKSGTIPSEEYKTL